nr:restriction endonuclease subunit S [uncultured Flavobacterium sp.]
MLQNNKLPKNWKWIKLGSAAKFIDYRGKTPKKTDSGIPLITAKNVKMGFINDHPREYIAENDYQNWMTRGIPNIGDILFTTEAPMGNVAQIKTTTRIALAQRMITFQTYDIVINSFLKYNLMSPQFQEILNSKGTGTTVKGIKASVLKQIEIPLPPLGTQQLIVSKIEELFSELDKGIEDLKTAQQQLKIYRQSVLKWAFEGKLTNTKVKDGIVPKGWELKKIGEVLKVSSGKGIKINQLKGGNYSVYGGNGLNGFHSEYFIEEPVLIIGRVGVKCGVTHITKPKSWVSDNALIVKPIIKDFDINFFKLKLEFENLNKLSVSTAQPVISGNSIYSVTFFLPKLEQQQRIVQEIESRLSVADKMEQSITQSLRQAEALRQSILKKAFSGELI